jgi:hypothetical protein
MDQLLVNWQELDGGRAGSIDDVSNFYRRETNERLVVLGAPGSGKSDPCCGHSCGQTPAVPSPTNRACLLATMRPPGPRQVGRLHADLPRCIGPDRAPCPIRT